MRVRSVRRVCRAVVGDLEGWIVLNRAEHSIHPGWVRINHQLLVKQIVRPSLFAPDLEEIWESFYTWRKLTPELLLLQSIFNKKLIQGCKIPGQSWGRRADRVWTGQRAGQEEVDPVRRARCGYGRRGKQHGCLNIGVKSGYSSSWTFSSLETQVKANLRYRRCSLPESVRRWHSTECTCSYPEGRIHCTLGISHFNSRTGSCPRRIRQIMSK